jgi:hypothetical protein
MDKKTRATFDNLSSTDVDTRQAAYDGLMRVTDKPVDWAYDVWDELLAKLRHKDGHQRAIAAQLLCKLAKSDPKQRLLKDFEQVFAITRDEKFVTARHTRQSLWEVAVMGKKHQKLVVDRLADRFQDCAAEKNCTLIRYDIQVALRQIYDVVKDEQIKTKALALIETEPDLKYQKKYATVWKKK